ncbi:hypothetical protein [Halorubellus salinus]|uniref:hypothetical protein n=1 Tax=Halorubellus salinus TaxID=755309 RepID=UPI001D06AFCB|nr:hypothetical protein [Halorubellus salinus]
MSPSSRRSVLRAAAVGTTLIVPGCSSIGGSAKPPVDINVLNSTPVPVRIELSARTQPEPDGEVLFSDVFELSPYKPGTQTKGSSMERVNAFAANEALIVCHSPNDERFFKFEPSCQNTDELDEGFTVEWADNGDTGDELRYRQSTCSG